MGRTRAGSASAANHTLATTPHRAVSPPLPAPLRAIPTTKYRSCDLGCGGGGTSLGLQLAGVEVGMGVDLNGMSLKAFERNFYSQPVWPARVRPAYGEGQGISCPAWVPPGLTAPSYTLKEKPIPPINHFGLCG